MSDAGRTSKGAYVASSRLVVEVLTNGQGHYSAAGYGPRMQASFGLIYLGLDESPAYREQADAINAAIQALPADAAFRMAYAAARRVAAPGGGSPGEGFSDGSLTTAVLADVAKAWFDLPDGRNIKTSGELLPLTAPSCPGDYAAMSGAIFLPDPPLPLRLAGELNGRRLKAAALRFVREQRANPTARGPLSTAILSHFPGDDDLAARTLIGVMMGYLPTTEGNLKHVFGTWLDSEEFGTLKAAFNASGPPDLHARAHAILLGRLVQTMQEAPTPVAAWRTATRDHQIATSAGLVDVRRNDVVEVRIQDATRADRLGGVDNVIPIFGGDRAASPTPLHACPGYGAAMAVMLGALAGAMHDP